MKRIHFISGIIITIFIALHLFNHGMSVVGAKVHMEMMDKLRLVYRNIFAEFILLIAVLVQIISGLKLFFQQRKSIKTFYRKVHLYSGLYLAFFLTFHVSAVLIGRYILELDTNFYFGVAGLNAFPFYLFFVPYYGLSVLAFFGHIAAIHQQKMRKSIVGFTPTQQANFILGIGVVSLLIIFYGLTNGFSGVEIPVSHHILIGK